MAGLTPPAPPPRYQVLCFYKRAFKTTEFPGYLKKTKTDPVTAERRAEQRKCSNGGKMDKNYITPLLRGGQRRSGSGLFGNLTF